jgi:hypothetical protein
MLTSQCSHTDIFRTVVAVITVQKNSRDTPSSCAEISFGAKIPIVTHVLVRDKLATGLGITRIFGTVVAIIAGQYSRRNALSQMAVIAGRAKVVIIAQRLIDCRDTPDSRLTDTVSARIIVQTFDLSGTKTDSVLADIQFSTGIAVITFRTGNLGKHTSRHRITRIVSTRIAVIALQILTDHTTRHRVTAFDSIAHVVVNAR